MGKRKIVEEHDIPDDAESPEEEANKGVSLFDTSAINEKAISHIHVNRQDPEEGFLGKIGADATEADILAKWGGGEFVLYAKNAIGRIVQRRTLKLAGDPIFVSDIAEARWRRVNNLPPRPREGAAAQQTREEAGASFKELLAMMEERDERRRREQREEDERRERDRERREQEERRMRLDAEERARKDAIERDERHRREAMELEERRRREAREDEERRNRQHKEDLERIAAQNAAAMNQQQQMFAMLSSMMKAEASAAKTADPVAAMMKGVDLAMAMQGAGGNGEPKDIMQTLIEKGPGILAELRETGAAALREMRGDRAEEGDALTLRGPLAAKVRILAKLLKDRGEDPEESLGKLIRMIAGQQKALPAEEGAPARASRPRKPRKPKKPKKTAAAPAPAAAAPPPKVAVPQPMRPTGAPAAAPPPRAA